MRSVVLVAANSSVGSPSVNDFIGRAITATTTIAVTNTITGRFVICEASLYHTVLWLTRCVSCGPFFCAATIAFLVFPLKIRVPATPNNAGSSVIATIAAKATVAAAANPILVMNGIPTIVRADNAMTTVAAANTTALPAVATARAADSL